MRPIEILLKKVKKVKVKKIKKIKKVKKVKKVMDNWQTAFKNMYTALSFLAGSAGSSAMGTAGWIGLFKGQIPAVASVNSYLAAALPGKVLGFHSTHALVLFNAIRATEKYGDKRQQLREIQAAMDKFIKAIDQSIKTSSPIPTKFPEAGMEIFFDQKALLEHRKLIDVHAEFIKAFVNNLDLVLADIRRCLNEWNKFLKDLRQFLKTDTPRNIFESLGQSSLYRERDMVWYRDETGFAVACNSLLGHRNNWSKLIDYGNGAPLPSLRF
jgi:hypothetical protein